MPGSLIEQLQMDAVDRDVRTSDLLRKALLVASRLDIPGVPEWINKELSGYELKDEVPIYRTLHGRVMARTFRGWIPVQFPTSELQAKVAEQSVYQSVATIEDILSEDGDPRINFSPESQQILQTMFQLETEFTCVHSRPSLAAILDEVRNRILRWSVQLDNAGVKGNGLTFTQQEKKVAHNIVVEGVLNVGVLGDVHSVTNIAAGDHARAGNIGSEEIQQLIAAIEPHVSAASLLADEKDEFRGALADLRKESARDKVAEGKVRAILRRVLRTASRIGDHVLAAGIKVVVEGWMRAHGLVP
jgi:hypothetical protein